MKRTIKLTESELHRIVKESVNRMLKEVSLKGKSGEEYSLHGDNFDSWATLAKLRKHQLNTPNRIMTGREKDAYKRDDDNSMNSMIDYVLTNNMRGKRANRLVDIVDKTSDNISKDIIDNYDPKVESKQHNGNKHTVRLSESDLHRIVKESVRRVLRENLSDYDYCFTIPNYDYDSDDPWDETFYVKETMDGLQIFDVSNQPICILRGKSLRDYKTGPDNARVDMSNINDDALIADMERMTH